MKMPHKPILPRLSLEKSIEIFTEQARSAVVSRNVFIRLFENGSGIPDGEKAMHETAPYFFHWLNTALIDYTLLQAAKLLDPATTERDGLIRKNVTCDSIILIHPDSETQDRLKALGLIDFWPYITEVRNRLIAHSDEESFAAQQPLGAFPTKVGQKFYTNLQEFVNILHDGIHPLQDSMILNDVDSLISSLVQVRERRWR